MRITVFIFGIFCLCFLLGCTSPGPPKFDNFYNKTSWKSRYALGVGPVLVDNDVIQNRFGVKFSEVIFEEDKIDFFAWGDYNPKQEEVDELDFGADYRVPVTEYLNLNLAYSYYHMPGFICNDINHAKVKVFLNIPFNPGIGFEHFWGDDEVGNIFGFYFGDKFEMLKNLNFVLSGYTKFNDHFRVKDAQLTHSLVEGGFDYELADNLILFTGLNYQYSFYRKFCDNEFFPHVAVTYKW